MSNDPNVHNEPDRRANTIESDLHEAILANSLPIVQMLLARGADPNISPLIAPIGIISTSNEERARDLHRTLGRVFRSCREGTINPLTVAVCNAYHHCAVGRESAIGVVEALLNAGADVHNTCSGIAFCKIGSYPSVVINSAKTPAKVALFLKRFPPLKEEHHESCENMMDDVAAMIVEKGSQSVIGSKKASASAIKLWTGLLHDEDSCSDIVLICLDGQVRAHQCILKFASPYFRSILSGSGKEKANISYSASVMKAVLEFIYIGQFDEDKWIKKQHENELMNLFSAASEYKLEALIDHIECWMISSLNSSESCKVALLLAQYNHLEHLKAACLKYIEEHSTTVLMDASFLTISNDHPEVWKELTNVLISSSTRKREFGSLSDNEGVDYNAVFRPEDNPN